MARKRVKLVSGFNLGGEAAEVDRLLDEAFVESSDFKVIESRSEHRCFIVGRTGSGKSAVLKRLEELNPEHVIRINPENLSLPYITNLQAIRYLDSLEVNLDTFWHALWRHVLLVEIIRHRYNVDSVAAKTNVLAQLRNKVMHDKGKEAALEYLNEFEGQFWCEADERVREITDKFTKRLSSEAGGKLATGPVEVGGKRDSEYETSVETRAEQVDRFQRIVNENQLARLSKMIDVLDQHILTSSNDFRYVVIDDLDREWVDERIANDLVRCLFSTVYSLQHVRNLKVLVALRTNIFQELDFGRKGGGQEEKLRGMVLEMRWTPGALEQMLDERVKLVATEVGIVAGSLADLLPNPNNTMGKPVDYILERTLLRPRDALAFANECLTVGVGKGRLSWADIKTAERAYSTGRLLAARDEWKGTYPGIDRVVEKFRRTPIRMTKTEFQDRLEEIMLMLSDPDFPGTKWLTDASATMWTGGRDTSWFELYQPLAHILYNIGLIGLSKQNSSTPVFVTDDPRYIEQESNVERCEFFFIHRMFHQGLDSPSARDLRDG